MDQTKGSGYNRFWPRGFIAEGRPQQIDLGAIPTSIEGVDVPWKRFEAETMALIEEMLRELEEMGRMYYDRKRGM